MITPNIATALDVLVEKTLPKLYLLPQTQSLIVKGSRKWDRLDNKLMKEAIKINKREYNSQHKIQGASSQRKGSITYRSYTIDFKKKLITSIREEFKDSGKSLSKLIRQKARMMKIHPKNISRWYHAKEIKKKEGGRKALYPQMELKLANFILNNPTIKRKYILRQAKQILQELNIPGREQFNFSKGWYERFRERLSKSKVFTNVKSDENQVKYEVKMDDLDEDNAKSEEEDEEVDYKSEQSYNSQDLYSSDQQEELEEQLQEAEREESNSNTRIRFSKPKSKNSRSFYEKSLFFEDEDEGKNKNNLSMLIMIDDEEKHMEDVKENI